MRFYTNVSRIGNKICVREKTEDGAVKFKVDYEPRLFLESNKETEFKTLDGQFAKKVEFENISAFRGFIGEYGQVSGMKLYGQTNHVLAYINDSYPMNIEFDSSKIDIYSLDIETRTPIDDSGRSIGFPSAEKADCEIVLITMQEIATGRTFTFSSKELQGEVVDTIYDHAKDEASLLKKFVLFWNQSNVEVVTGWNVEVFDMPFIVNRITNILGEEWTKRLSPWGVVDTKRKSIMGKQKEVVDILGVSVLDFQDLYKKFTYTKQESYSLAHISSMELDATKLEHEEFKSFNDFIDCNPYVEELKMEECQDESERIGRKLFLLDQETREGLSVLDIQFLDSCKDYFLDRNALKERAKIVCWNKFVRYNVRDVELVTKLEGKLKLIDLALTMAYRFKMNVTDVFGPVKMWDTIIHNTLFAESIVIPLRESMSDSDDEGIEGAYVKDPVPGLVEDFLTLDATSLYPSNAMTMNMSPETYLGQIDVNIERLLAGEVFEFPENVAVSPIGAMFSKEKRGIIPRLIESFMKERKATKGEMLSLESEVERLKESGASDDQIASLQKTISALDNKQQAIKLSLNSLYGAMANEGFRFFNQYIAESITMLGQYALRSVERDIDLILSKRFGFKDVKKFLVYIDTDSLIFEMRHVTEKFMPNATTEERIKAVEKMAVDIVQEEVNKIMANICEQLNAYENKINFKLEAVGDKAIFLKKKMYVMRVHSSEGVSYAKPKYKVKGISMVRSSTPAFIRKKMKNSLDIIFNETEASIQKYISDCRDEFDQLRTEEIAFPIGANNLTKWYDKDTLYINKTPIQVRAALLYNQKIAEMGLNGVYPEIGEGGKIKFVYLKMPNPLKENVIGFPADTKMPPEFGLKKYVDKDQQFDKTLVNSMQKILGAIGWNAIEQSSLDSFFE